MSFMRNRQNTGTGNHRDTEIAAEEIMKNEIEKITQEVMSEKIRALENSKTFRHDEITAEMLKKIV